jgi:YmgG-like glycine-zipper protein
MHTTRTLALTAVVGAALTLTACGANRRTTTVESTGDVAAPTTPTSSRTIDAGATLVATLDQTLGTKVSKAGDAFSATVSSPLTAQDGSVVVPAGAKLEGRVTAIDDSDNATEPALIRLAFDRIRINGQSHPFAAAIVQSNPVQTSEQTSSDRTRQIVIGGAVGAALGAILGDKDLKNIIIGGALGAAAGSIISLGTEVNATLPAGSQMTVRTTQATQLH